MVGLKTFWILISTLFLLAACVPQTKQTECGANEAFNASLRTCVPIVGGPSSFINVSSYSPMFTQTRYKSDATTLTFTISVSNPYNQSYSVEWERVFNAAPVSMCSNSLSCSFSAAFLGTVLGEVGTHILTAKVKDGNGAVVDSHHFELKINDLPRPVINTATLTPAGYAFDVYPTDPRVQFSFTIRNNNAVLDASDNYRTIWSVVKNGATVLTEIDPFTIFTPNGTNTAFFGVSPTPAFNPATLGVGSYIVRAVVQNDVPGEIVAEQQWNVVVKQPDLSNVTVISSPSPGVAIKAHHNVPYNAYPTLSWVYDAPVTQPNFCVTVDDRDGTYPGDGKSIHVRFYLDGIGGDICTKATLDSPGTQQVCLLDGDPCVGSAIASNVSVPPILRFLNTSATVEQNHKVTARLFDEATTFEFQPSNVIPSNGSYPIEWLVLVKPVNIAPQMSFGPAASNPPGCVSSGVNSRSGCQVQQGTPFKVSFAVTDDFYSPVTDAGEFQWDVKLKMNGSDISTPPKVTSCSKAFGATTPAYAGSPAVWECELEVPHYIASGALHPNGPFQVVASMQDNGSPVGGTPLSSTSLTWNLVVTETNTISPNITILPQTGMAATTHISRETPIPEVYFDPIGSNYATETDTVTFRIAVRDPELDDFQYAIRRCGPGSNGGLCTTAGSQQITPGALNYLRAANLAVTLPFADTVLTDPLLITAYSHQLSEVLLLDIGEDVDTLTERPVYFEVEVADKPSNLVTPLTTHKQILTLWVRNFNPAPVFNTVGAFPAPNLIGTPYPVMSGYPFTIHPGTVTDPSTNSLENTVAYQWYIQANGSGTWSAIPDANQANLKWTPDHSISTTLLIKLCVGDNTIANPILPPGAGGNCTTETWHVAPKSYLAQPIAAGSASSEVAVWHDTQDGDPTVDVIYSAYIDANKDIRVNKTVRDANLNMNVTSFQTVTFTALNAAVAGDVSNISLTGTTDSLYVAYLASASTNPSAMYPRLRRIDKSFSLAVGEKTNYAHKGKFGFSYTQPTVVVTACPSCTHTAGTLAGNQTIQFSAPLTAGDTLTINGRTFTAANPGTGIDEICDSLSCSANDTATALANIINTSTYPEFQGLTATATTNTVTLRGLSGFDHLDLMTIPVSNKGMSNIFIANNYWFIPVINASAGGSNERNIHVISGEVGATNYRLQDAAVAVNYANPLTNIGQVAAFDAKLNSSQNLVVASISSNIANAGRAQLSRYLLTGRIFDPFPLPAESQRFLFGTKLFEEIKVSADLTTNQSIYVLAKERIIDDGEYHIARSRADLSIPPSEYLLVNQLSASDSTGEVISDTIMLNPTLVTVPGSNDARIFFNSEGTPAGPVTTRVARWRSDNTISCGACAPIGLDDTTSKIAVSNVFQNMTLGTLGNQPLENEKDVVFFISNYHSGGANYATQIGLINLEPEAIHSTSHDDVNHLWRPPFAK